jgi:hypothetical protein
LKKIMEVLGQVAMLDDLVDSRPERTGALLSVLSQHLVE